MLETRDDTKSGNGDSYTMVCDLCPLRENWLALPIQAERLVPCDLVTPKFLPSRSAHTCHRVAGTCATSTAWHPQC